MLAYDLVGGWTSPNLFLRLLTLGDGPWEPLRAGFTRRGTNERVKLAMAAAHPALAAAFGQGVDWFRPTIDDPLLAEIAQHRAVVVVSEPTGATAFERALTLLRAVNAVVDAGALGGRCRTSGVAHGHDGLQALAAEAEVAARAGPDALAEPLLAAYVRLDPARACTFGMHALGRPDVRLSGPEGDLERDLPRLRAAALAVLRGREVDPAPDDRGMPEPLANPLGLARV